MKRIYKFFGVLGNKASETVVAGGGFVIHPEAKIVNHQSPEIGVIKIGLHSHIRGELLLFAHGGTITIGEYCYVGQGSRIWSAKSICIGNRVLIAHLVNIVDNITHPISARERHKQFKEIVNSGHPTEIDLKEMSVVIEDDVWIGCMSVILKGVTIGDGAIIAANSVVNNDVKANTVVGGSPAKYISDRT